MAAARLTREALGLLRALPSRVAEWPIWSLSRPLRTYLILVTVCAVAGMVVTLVDMPWRLSQLLIFLGILACGIVAIESTRAVREVHGTVGRDLQSVWYLAAAITLPPGYAMLAPVPLAAWRLWRVRSGLMHRRVFS